MQWFQYRPGVVVESFRVAHSASPTEDAELLSWCGRKLRLKDVEETCEPNESPEPRQAIASSPYVPCLLLAPATTESLRPVKSSAVHVAGTRTLAGLLRQTQWLLDDVAPYLPEGRCSVEECGLAKTLEQLVTIIREHAAHTVIEGSGE